jgi:hypothetical protein
MQEGDRGYDCDVLWTHDRFVTLWWKDWELLEADTTVDV